MTDFSEEPSDGFKIGIAILGVVRATENLWWKIFLKFQPRKSLLHKAKCMKLNWSLIPRKVQAHETQLEFHISKTPYFSIYTSLNSKYSKHTLLQCFFELNLGWNAWKSPWMKEGNKMILFFWIESQINSEKTIFLLFFLVIGKKLIIYNVGLV